MRFGLGGSIPNAVQGAQVMSSDARYTVYGFKVRRVDMLMMEKNFLSTKYNRKSLSVTNAY